MPKRRKSPVRKIKYKPQRKRSSFKSFVFAILVVLFSTVLLVGFMFYKFINAPFSSASLSSVQMPGSLEGARIKILAAKMAKINDPSSTIDELYLVSIDKENKEYYTYKIPVHKDIEYYGNYGRGTLANVFATGNKDELRGIYLLEKTILKTLAVPVDGFVMIDNEGYSKITSIIGEVDRNDLSVSLRLKNLYNVPGAVSVFRDVTVTNLKLKDVYDLLLFFRSTPKSGASFVELVDENLAKPSTFDKIWQKNQEISDLKKEGIKVYVANASDPKKPGLALWGQRIVENLGVDVLETDNTDKKFSENTIISESFDLKTVHALKKTLDIKEFKLVSDLNQKDGYNPQVFRTKVSLFLVNN